MTKVQTIKISKGPFDYLIKYGPRLKLSHGPSPQLTSARATSHLGDLTPLYSR